MSLRDKLDRIRAAKMARQGSDLNGFADPLESVSPTKRQTSSELSATLPPRKGKDALLAAMKGKVFRASDLLHSPDGGKTDRPRPTGSDAPDGCVDILTSLRDGQRIETPMGSVVRVRRQLSLVADVLQEDDQLYAFPYRELATGVAASDLVAIARDESLSELGVEDLLFLDTETTGLAGGTGTYAFLVGVGWFEGHRFTVDQYLMEDFDGEGAVMWAVGERVKRHQALVTYNGKRFDTPLLQTRFHFNAIPVSLDLPAVDLLYPVRRIWRQALPDCSLSTVERRILGMEERKSDAHGSRIPQIFFDYARGRRRKQMIPVLDHNAQDIVSLASLLGLLGQMTRQPVDLDLDHPLAWLGLARLIEWGGRAGESVECMENALLHARDSQTIYTISTRIARLYKKEGRLDEAVAIWESQTQNLLAYNIHTFIDLAKHHEHRKRNYSMALDLTRRALQFCESQPMVLERSRRGERLKERERLLRLIPDLKKREERLIQKLGGTVPRSEDES